MENIFLKKKKGGGGLQPVSRIQLWSELKSKVYMFCLQSKVYNINEHELLCMLNIQKSKTSKILYLGSFTA